jgi:hypothetical protein
MEEAHQAGVTVNGGGMSRVFQIDGMVTASISGMTITGGDAGSYGNGGGLLNLGTATLTDCTISGDSAGSTSSYLSGGNGGGVFNSGTITLTNCTVSDDSSNGNGAGGMFNGVTGGGQRACWVEPEVYCRVRWATCRRAPWSTANWSCCARGGDLVASS